jgi:hypothetical protein
VVRDGFLVIVAGPGSEGQEVGSLTQHRLSPQEGRASELVDYQLEQLAGPGEELAAPALTLQTCISQKRWKHRQHCQFAMDSYCQHYQHH